MFLKYFSMSGDQCNYSKTTACTTHINNFDCQHGKSTVEHKIESNVKYVNHHGYFI
jgi:hypothetical protein